MCRRHAPAWRAWRCGRRRPSLVDAADGPRGPSRPRNDRSGRGCAYRIGSGRLRRVRDDVVGWRRVGWRRVGWRRVPVGWRRVGWRRERGGGRPEVRRVPREERGESRARGGRHAPGAEPVRLERRAGHTNRRRDVHDAPAGKAKRGADCGLSALGALGALGAVAGVGCGGSRSGCEAGRTPADDGAYTRIGMGGGVGRGHARRPARPRVTGVCSRSVSRQRAERCAERRPGAAVRTDRPASARVDSTPCVATRRRGVAPRVAVRASTWRRLGGVNPGTDHAPADPGAARARRSTRARDVRRARVRSRQLTTTV